jgi:hypothetical protein
VAKSANALGCCDPGPCLDCGWEIFAAGEVQGYGSGFYLEFWSSQVYTCGPGVENVVELASGSGGHMDWEIVGSKIGCHRLVNGDDQISNDTCLDLEFATATLTLSALFPFVALLSTSSSRAYLAFSPFSPSYPFSV